MYVFDICITDEATHIAL